MTKEKSQSILEDLKKAFLRLREALDLPKTQISRDATIQRFEFTFELSWKLMQTILKDNSIEAYGPKNAIRESAKLSLIDDPSKWFEFLEARNQIAHTYNDKLADDVYNKANEFIMYLQVYL